MDPVPPNSQTEQPISQQQPSSLSVGPKPQRKSWLWLVGGAVLLVAGVSSGLLLGKQMYTHPQPLPTPSPSSAPEPSAPPSISSLRYQIKTRYFNLTDNFFEKQKYPSEITSIPEELLISMACSPFYSGWNGKYSYNDETTTTSYPLTDPTILSYIDSITKTYPDKQVAEIMTCTPQSGKTIVLYSLGPCGGGCSGIPYVGIANGLTVKEITSINEPWAYFGCRQPLQLTNTGIFYFQCGGGDGGGASASLYKLSLSSQTVAKIIQCTLQESAVSCK